MCFSFFINHKTFNRYNLISIQRWFQLFKFEVTFVKAGLFQHSRQAKMSFLRWRSTFRSNLTNMAAKKMSQNLNTPCKNCENETINIYKSKKARIRDALREVCFRSSNNPVVLNQAPRTIGLPAASSSHAGP